ncbi:DUF6575 domain-containing protein [Rheinheimera faecalis]|uniref:DUF6575 domain-containing protein n=1 Tax=Rheinheimera faecalis TaxID=2901141 RepID=UPI001E4FAAD1|nr:DUF6575 domain-containing protein [Rheinheimera faecalis]
MSILPNTPYFGKLTIKSVYEFYDGPKLFLAVNGTGNHFISFWIDSTDEYDEWLYSSIDQDRLIELELSKIKLRDIYTYPSDYIFRVKTFFDSSLSSELNEVPLVKMTEDILPPHDYFIDGKRVVTHQIEAQQTSELYIKSQQNREKPKLSTVGKVSDAFSQLYNSVLRSLDISGKYITPIDARTGSFILRLRSPQIEQCLPVIKTIFNILNNSSAPYEDLVSLNIDISAAERFLEEIVDGKVKIQFGLENKFEAELNITEEKANETLAILKAASASYVSSLDVPQANDLHKVFSIIEIKSKGDFVTPESLGLTTERQVAYYLHAARVLGLLSSSNAINSVGYQFIALDHSQRMKVTAIRFESSACGWAWLKWAGVTKISELDPNTATQFLIETCKTLSQDTAERRAKTLQRWQIDLSPFR